MPIAPSQLMKKVGVVASTADHTTKKYIHPAYQQIIGMGESAVLPVLRDLKNTFADWFWALTAITGDNPIAHEDVGDVQKMTEAWLKWGRMNGYDV